MNRIFDEVVCLFFWRVTCGFALHDGNVVEGLILCSEKMNSLSSSEGMISPATDRFTIPLWQFLPSKLFLPPHGQDVLEEMPGLVELLVSRGTGVEAIKKLFEGNDEHGQFENFR